MTEKPASQLWEKYKANQCTPEEVALVEFWFDELNKDSQPDLSVSMLEEVHTDMWAKVRLGMERKPVKRKLWSKFAAAAILLLVGTATIFFFKLSIPQQKEQVQLSTQPVILPGGNKAILTLANGKKIVLNGLNNGLVAVEGASSISKTANGEVVYQEATPTGILSSAAITYNTISVPKGGAFQVLTLSDGSRAWVNSASTLRFPTAFTADERKVELTGEAYFEVTYNPEKPFKVTCNSQTVEVLGTHFNINAYHDEPAIKTTLLSGKVKVTASVSNEQRVLQPGQQSALTANSFTVKPVETEAVVAWKNGQFIFENDNIQYIMRTIARWYNVEVEYKGAIPEDSFGGGVSRFKDVSEVLNILQLTGKVHFKIEGRKITVSK